MDILLHSVIKLRLGYCFENENFSGEYLHIVPLILNNFFVICRLILSKGKKIDLNCESDFFLRPYRPAQVTIIYPG